MDSRLLMILIGAAILFLGIIAAIVFLIIAIKKKKKKPVEAEEAAQVEIAVPVQGVDEKNADEPFDAEYSAARLEETLRSLGLGVSVCGVSIGAGFARYELLPDIGERADRIRDFAADVALTFGEEKIITHIPLGEKRTIGIDVPLREPVSPTLGSIIKSGYLRKPPEFSFVIGAETQGRLIAADIAGCAHLLIAGALGTGKSTALNSIAAALILGADKNLLRVIMIDMQGLELNVYSGLPHLLMPVISDGRTASGALGLAEIEMNERYKKLSGMGLASIEDHNERAVEKSIAPMQRIVIFIDGVADMLRDNNEASTRLFNLLEKGAKVGVHAVLSVALPCSSSLLEKLAQSMPSKICLRSPSKQAAELVAGSLEAVNLMPVGDMLVRLKNPDYVQHAQGVAVSREEIGWLLRKSN